MSLFLFLFLLLFSNDLLVVVSGKEIIATTEWQKIGPNDTLPAGLEIRMDLHGGGKWARLIPKEIDNGLEHKHSAVAKEKRCGPSCRSRQQARRQRLRGAVVATQQDEEGVEKNLDTPHEDTTTTSSTTHRRLNMFASTSYFPFVLVLFAGIMIGVVVGSHNRRWNKDE